MFRKLFEALARPGGPDDNLSASRRNFLAGATAVGGVAVLAPFALSRPAAAQAVIQTPGGPMTVDEEAFRRRYGRPFPSGRRVEPRYRRRRRRRARGRDRCRDPWFRDDNPGYCGVRRRRRRRRRYGWW